MTKSGWGFTILIILLLVLAGCNFSQGEDEEEERERPTLGTPILWALSQTETATPEATTPVAAISPTAVSTEIGVSTEIPAPTTLTASVAPPSSLTPQILASATAIGPFVPTNTALFVAPPTVPGIVTAVSISTQAAVILSPTTPPTQTSVPTQEIVTPGQTFAPPPSFTPATYVPPTTPLTAPPTQISVPTQEIVPPGQTFAPPPSFTPVIQPSQTPVPTSVSASAQVCATCGNLRLRASPGTAGSVLTNLAENTTLTVIGRTENNAWVQVRLADGTTGWVAAQYLVVTFDLTTLSVTGVAQDTAWPTAVPVVGPGGINTVSGVTATSRRIFLDGRAKGNSAYSFTRVGDSITASPYFLTPIGSGSYSMGDYGYLQGAIRFFSGPNGRGANPFAAASIAARNGWSTESVLSPGLADPNVCRSGETPLECEYRLVKPSVALIMFGTNDSGGMPSATFSANLTRIVQISINMGVIPVLSTIPPKHYNPATDGRVTEFNQIIIATARTYDVPLWNYWAAMSPLPSEGLDADGVHPSIPPDTATAIFDATHLQYGYTMRNFTALQVLYTLWQQVLYDGDNAVPATSVPDSGQPQPTANPGNPPGGGTTTSCPGALPPRLTVGGQGRVTPGVPNKVRANPSTAAAQVGQIPGEGVFSVLAGPQCADGYQWWQVNYQGLIGWTADGNGTEYWVEPYP